MKKILVASLTMLLVLVSVSYALSFPQPVGYVNDFAKILKAEETTNINTELGFIDRNTTVQIAIVTVNDLQNTTIEDFSAKLFKDWGIGQKGKDNGLLILVVPSTRQYRFEVGYGLEGILNDAKIGQIGRDCFKTYFANNSYYSGIDCAVNRVYNEISVSGTNETSSSTIIPAIPDIWVYIIVIIVVIILIIITKGRIIFFLFEIAGSVFGFGGGRSGGGGSSGDY